MPNSRAVGRRPAPALPSRRAGRSGHHAVRSPRFANGRGRYRGRGFRRRGCYFCETKEPIDYKNPQLLRRFIADTGRIDARRKSMVCARHQRGVARAIKRARYLGLLPYMVRRRLHA